MKYYLPGFIIVLALIFQDSNGEPVGCEKSEPQFSEPSDTLRPMPPAFLIHRTATTLNVEFDSERHNGRARKLVIRIRNYTTEQIEHGVITLYQPYPTVVQILPLNTSVGKRSNYSALVPTNRHICEIKWVRQNPQHIRSTYYVARLAVKGEVVAAGSLTQHVTWMDANIQRIANLKLIDLALPGTINSALFIPFGNKNPDHYSELDWMFSQEEDIFNQLVYGIRAFDILLTVNHIPEFDFFEFRIKGRQDEGDQLEKILKQFRRFLRAFPDEVVFINFRLDKVSVLTLNHLNGLVTSVLGTFRYDLGTRTLKDVMQQTLGQVIRGNKRAIITYPKHEYMTALLPPVRYLRVTKSRPVDLKNELSTMLPTYKESADWFYNAIVKLEPSNNETRRELATQLNPKVADWCYQEPAFRDNINIISTEYFASTDIVSCCIRLNLKRAEGSRR